MTTQKKPAKKAVKKIVKKAVRNAPPLVKKSPVPHRNLAPSLKKAVSKIPAAKTAESNLWNWFAQVKSEFMDNTTSPPFSNGKLHMRRIENSSESFGADVELCFDGVCAVIELKTVPRPINPKARINTGLTMGQAMFLKARHDAGGYSWLLLQVGGDTRYLVPGEHALNCIGLVEPKILQKYSKQLIFGDQSEILNLATGR